VETPSQPDGAAREGRAADLVLTLFFVVSFFSLGEAAFEAHVNYPAWLALSGPGFAPYHRVISARIGLLIVPLVVSTVLNVLLLWYRPAQIPGLAVWATIGLQAVAWTSAILVQIPIQMSLGQHGYSRELIEQLIWTDLLYRRVPSHLRLLISGWMLYAVVRAARRGAGMQQDLDGR
jgi:hypothetical protein